MTDQSLREVYRKDIDGLRAIAVTVVVLYHTGLPALSGGFVGVDIFFVISGYLIGAHVYRDIRDGSFSLARFYQRRAKRILPALFFILALCYVAALLLLTPADLKLFAQYALTTVGSVSNVLASRRFDYFAKAAIDNPLLMTWSLGVEEQFYVCFPLLMMALAAWARWKTLGVEQARRLWFWVVLVIAMLSFALCVWTTAHERMSAYFLLPSRAWELATGLLLAMYEARSDRRSHELYGGRRLQEFRAAAGVAAIAFAVVHYGSATMFPGVAALLPVAGAALVLSAPQSWLNYRALSLAPMQWIGLVSYSWYLWHWPLLSFASITLAGTLPVRTAMVVSLVALGCAWLSYRFVEQPFRRSKRAPSPLLWRYALACALFLLPALVMKRTQGLPHRYPSVAAQDAVLVLNPTPCFGGPKPETSPACLPADDGRQAVALFGDSHASALAPEMLRLTAAANLRLLTVAHKSCPPLQAVVRRSVEADADRECVRFNAMAVKRLADDASVRTVVLAALWAGPVYDPPGFGYVPADKRADTTAAESAANLRRGLVATVAALRGAGKRVVLVKDVTPMAFDPVGRVDTYLIPARRSLAWLLEGPRPAPGLTMPNELYARENSAANRMLEDVAHEQGAEVFNLAKDICSETACTYFANGLLMYRDQNHISLASARKALMNFPLLSGAAQGRKVN